MKITEEVVAAYRAAEWPNLLPLHAGYPGAPLPDDLVSGSWDMFPELHDGSGTVVALLAFTQAFPKLSPEVEWYAIQHQSGGLACHHPRFVGMPLALRPEVQVGSSRVDLQACKLEYSIVSPK